ncbi:MAG TPA: kelch repeat-containing protein, partial [Dehalococcoidia bacterium]
MQAEVFDPVLNTWTAVENGAGRWNQTATLLLDGRVLLAGGETASSPTDLLEWFNPRSNRIRELPARLSAARTLHAAAVLPDGSVLLSGGWNGQDFLRSTEIVTIDGSVKSAAALPSARALHTATALDNGCILIAGGLGVDAEVKSASLYCPNTGTFGSAGDLAVPRYGHLAFRLPNNNKVLITGGFSQGEPTAATELYDSDAHGFARAGNLTRARLGIAGAADPTTGAVLAVGGYTADGPLAGCGILRGPSAAFDKARYVDGDVVTVGGLGWTPSEKVNLVLTKLSFAKPGNLGQISFQNFQTTASALGRI